LCIASEYFSSNYSKYYFEKLIKRSLLYENTKKETSLIEDNKTVIGMYIRIYECKENNYLKSKVYSSFFFFKKKKKKNYYLK